MIGGQKQSAGDNSTVIQSGEAVTIINNSMSISQVSEILKELEIMVGSYTSQAQATVEERLSKFKEEVLNKFKEKDQANAEAFKDPDFQHSVGGAQRDFARVGDDNTASLLVDLLAQRSLRKSRDHTALILNEAVEKVCRLTEEDLSIIKIAFILFYTEVTANNFFELFIKLDDLLKNSLKYLKMETTSYNYLVSINCASISIGSRDLFESFNSTYGEFLTDGFTISEVVDAISDNDFRVFVFRMLTPVNQVSAINPYVHRSLDVLRDIHLFHSSDTKWRLNFTSRQKAMLSIDRHTGVDSDRNNLIALLDSKKWGQDVALKNISNHVSNFTELFKLWDSISLRSVELTPVAIAIAHASISSEIPWFRAPLSVWIK